LVKELPVQAFENTSLVLETAGEILDELTTGGRGRKDENTVYFSTSAAAILPWKAPADIHIVRAVAVNAFYLSWISETYTVADSSSATAFKPEIICKAGTSLTVFLNTKVLKDQIIYILTSAGALGHFFYTID